MSVRRFLGIWLLIALAMSANGVMRETVIVPVMKRTAADITSAALGVTIILGTTRWALRPVSRLSTKAAFRIGLTWAGMAVAFDFLVGHFIDSKSWSLRNLARPSLASRPLQRVTRANHLDSFARPQPVARDGSA